jgi:cobalt-precorrin 5A hydrolase
MKIALVTLSTQGARVISRLAQSLAQAELFVHASAPWLGQATRFQRLADITGALFRTHRALVFVAPCGAVVRAIAPHLGHKTTDPAVIVLDVGARHAVSLLSGHEGGANDLALLVANILGAEPVVTTTSESVKDLVVGVGCRRHCAPERIRQAITAALDELGLPLERVRLLASADLKADEPGLREAARTLHLPLRLIPGDDIRASCLSFARNPLAERKVKLPAVAEPCALLAGRRTTLVLHKTVFSGVTVSIAQERLPWSVSDPAAPSTARAARSKPLPTAL